MSAQPRLMVIFSLSAAFGRSSCTLVAMVTHPITIHTDGDMRDGPAFKSHKLVTFSVWVACRSGRAPPRNTGPDALTSAKPARRRARHLAPWPREARQLPQLSEPSAA